MKDLYIEPSSIIWNCEHFKNNKELYDEVISNIIDILEMEEDELIDIKFSKNLPSTLLNSFPYIDIQNGHWENKNEFTHIIYTSITRWMSKDYLKVNVQHDNQITIKSQPKLINPEVLELLELEKDSNSIMFSNENIPDNIPVISTNPFNIKKIELSHPDNDNLKIIHLNICSKDVFDIVHREEPKCSFSPKHHPKSGWGTKMPHEKIEICQNLLTNSLYEEKNKYRVRYNYSPEDKMFFAFRITHKYTFHPYPINEDEIPNEILVQLKHLNNIR
ncbi:hypothetical protein [Shewanella algae]|uniref:hypothetical protein n=2 Tax=Shewanella algae TaxID=38313 RepID=UPI0031F5C25B